jgi:hypothetical protein
MIAEQGLHSILQTGGVLPLLTAALASFFWRKRPSEGEKREETVRYQSLADRPHGTKSPVSYDPAAVQKIQILTEELSRIREAADLDALLVPILEKVCDALKSERATVFFADSTGDVLRSYKGVGLDTPIVLPLSAGIAGETIRLKTTIVANEIEGDARHYREADSQTGFQTTSILSAPLKDPRAEFSASLKS